MQLVQFYNLRTGLAAMLIDCPISLRHPDNQGLGALVCNTNALQGDALRATDALLGCAGNFILVYQPARNCYQIGMALAWPRWLVVISLRQTSKALSDLL